MGHLSCVVCKGVCFFFAGPALCGQPLSTLPPPPPARGAAPAWGTCTARRRVRWSPWPVVLPSGGWDKGKGQCCGWCGPAECIDRSSWPSPPRFSNRRNSPTYCAGQCGHPTLQPIDSHTLPYTFRCVCRGCLRPRSRALSPFLGRQKEASPSFPHHHQPRFAQPTATTQTTNQHDHPHQAAPHQPRGRPVARHVRRRVRAGGVVLDRIERHPELHGRGQPCHDRGRPGRHALGPALLPRARQGMEGGRCQGVGNGGAVGQ